MGTINYRSGDVITLGIVPLDIDDFRMEDDENEVDYDALNFEEHELMEEAKSILDKYSFEYLTDIKIENGYYEGFYLAIDNPFKYGLTDSYEKREAQKEITQLKKMMLELVDAGLVEVWPGWCTSYKSKEETIKKIPEVIRELRTCCRNADTWYTKKTA
jgi:hypothetical protein